MRRFIRSLSLVMPWIFLAAGGASASDLSALAARIGVTPESLAVADLQPSAAAILQKLQDASELRSLLQQQQTTADQAALQLADLSRQLALETDDATTNTAFATATQDFQVADDQVTQTLNALREAILDDVAEPNRQILDRVQVALKYKVPIEFGVQERTIAEWEQIQAAIRVEARASRLGEETEAECASLLSDIRLDSVVATAHSSLQAGVAAIAQAFAALSDG